MSDDLAHYLRTDDPAGTIEELFYERNQARTEFAAYAETVVRARLRVDEALGESPPGTLLEALDKLIADRDRLAAHVEDAVNLNGVMLVEPARTALERQELQRAVTFFASVIKSGEGWSPTCEAALRAALGGEGT